MRNSIIRRAATTCGLVVVIAAAVAGCGSSSSSSSSTSTSSAASSSAAASSSDQGGAKKAITDAYVAFFDANTPVDKKIDLVENGQAFASVLQAQAAHPLGPGAAASVSSVQLTDASHAAVMYSILLKGTPALPNQNGKAVLLNGQWKVAAATFCDLVAIAGQQSPACAQ